ncbi:MULTISPECIES: penicillin-binding protein 2 [Vibrio]|jgi:penicillin-binding protein 2|uniref:Peptidoglycan D,D-transpeptidase MrdA n=10 Tax=Gammaproteobacteria TaxID=1236 RepID=A0ABX1HYZ8_9VIBR|nr:MULTISPECIES: penicillin-binding protein 2 [Vibrio]MCR9564686.1 penicillin-binding protein 2 [Vibrio alginolyticus]RCW21244.1 peptidoglycan glycosyltransferase /cell elongation-specific peptidoglycan D,D-transpeptidase [Vibrio parahaemolyticus]AVF59332.1 penicillin-binding protein 2 [Vibrio diabolicus]EMD80999.1 penicillin-binding protein 2 (PBP-2) [Vibrio diabolicus E0666]KAB0322290.1 penicillin-binding protein 2 [Vibrio diabolicus]
MIRKRRSQIRDYQAEARLFASRAIVAFIGIVLLMGALVANMYNIQVNQFQDYQTRSNDNRIKVVPIAPNRGLIYDRNGVLLAENRPVFNLELTPEKIKDIDATIQELQTILEITPDQIERFHQERKRTRRFKSVPLLTQLNEKQVAVFSVNQYRFPGVEISATLKRYYPFSEVLTHVIGYVSRINDRDMQRLIREEKDANYQATRDIGKLGIEKYYEDLLHGTAGYQEVEVNSRGRVIRTLKYVPPVPGKDIVLNLDINLQLYVHQLLDGRRGSAVVIDPRDNGVLAMVSSPSYDPNSFVHGISGKDYRALLNDKNRPLVNRTTLGIYPPASTIKPFMAVAALQEGVVTPNTTRNDPGYWRIPNSNTRPFRDWLRWGHGRVDIIKSIEESVDTFYYQIAYDMGIDRISNWMMMFGFGDYTGIDIYEESKANMPTRDWKMSRHKTPWYKGDTIPVGIGQGYWTATPMQIAKATSVLVNEGEVIAPHLLKATIENGNDFEEQQTTEYVTYPPIKNVPKKYWDMAKEGMRRVNHGTRGTARRSFYKMSYQTAGKSGTAQVFGLGENEEYNADEIAEHLRDHALFTGFAPFDDPKVVVTVVLENAGGGSSNGAPVVRKIFDRVVLGPEEIEPENNAKKEVKQ